MASNVPLNAPRCIRINPATACNLRCQFCALSQEGYRAENPPVLLNFEEFKEMADDIKESFGRVKNIKLVGMGEPLVHPRFADMVSYLKQNDICEVSETITNGVMLTPEVSDKLIPAGLDFLKVSINGLSDEEYLEYTGKKVSFEGLVKNMRYFYENKTTTQVYIKIINYMVEDDKKLQFFKDTFEPICNVLNVENLVSLDGTDIDYDSFAPGLAESSTTTLLGNVEDSGNICNLPFYNMRLCPGGIVTPCCNEGKQYAIAKRGERTLKEIWQNEFYAFQRRMLDGYQQAAAFCRGCTSYERIYRPEDRLVEVAESLKTKYDAALGR